MGMYICTQIPDNLIKLDPNAFVLTICPNLPANCNVNKVLKTIQWFDKFRCGLPANYNITNKLVCTKLGGSAFYCFIVDNTTF